MHNAVNNNIASKTVAARTVDIVHNAANKTVMRSNAIRTTGVR